MDIYYRDPELFVKQAVVDRYIDDLAHTLSISRHSLNIVATAKGLIAGCLGILKKDNHTLDCSCDDDGILIPDITQIKDIFFRGLKWILVIEKEATFRSLAMRPLAVATMLREWREMERVWARSSM